MKSNTRKKAIIILPFALWLPLLFFAVFLQSETLGLTAALFPFAVLFSYFIFYKPFVYLSAIFLLLPVSVNIEDLGLSLGISIPGEILILPFVVLVLFQMISSPHFRKIITQPHPVTLLLLINLGWMLFTAFTGTMLVVSLKYVFIRLVFLLVFYFWILTLKPEDFFKLLGFFAFTTIFAVSWATLKHAQFGFIPQVNGWAPEPFFKDHTIYGALLALLFPVSVLTLFSRKQPPWLKLLFFAAIPFLLSGIFLSYSRAAWISIGAMAVLAVILSFRVRYGYFLAGIGVLILLAIGVRNPALEKLNQIRSERGGGVQEHLTSAINIKTSASNLERINRWESALKMFREKPVLGFGPGTYPFQYAPYQNEDHMTRISTWFGDVGGVHSEYLKPLSESGLPGFLSFIAIIILTLRSGFKVYLHSKNKQHRLYAAALMLGLSTYYFHGFFNYFLHTDKIAALFWGMTAMLITMENQLKMNNAAPDDVL
ncbi:MAG: O-antigen ligase family protein [Bacteroidota bacterium]